MKKLFLFLLTLCFAASTFAVSITDSDGNTYSCEDFSEHTMHDFAFEYGRYPPPCPTCSDPKYHVGKEWWVLKDKDGYPKNFGDTVDNPFGYLKTLEGNKGSPLPVIGFVNNTKTPFP